MSVRHFNFSNPQEQPGTRERRDEFGVWTITTQVRVRTDKARTLLPKVWSKHPVYSFALLYDATMVHEEAEHTVWELYYNGLDSDESLHQLEIIPGTNEEPIQTHPRYSGLGQGEFKYIEDYLSEPKDTVTVFDLTSTGLELLDKRIRGVESYISQAPVLRDTYFVRRTFRTIRSIQISPPPDGAPEVPAGCTWLLVPGEQVPVGAVYKVVDEYRLSGPLGWDTQLYSAA